MKVIIFFVGTVVVVVRVVVQMEGKKKRFYGEYAIDRLRYI